MPKNLDLNVAGRITDYKTSGQVETWKIGINYAMTDFPPLPRGPLARHPRAQHPGTVRCGTDADLQHQ
ncbi:hypothetical protein DdX_22267 [Ditylenchus destructor]|uniref:Uncharacterized protein n=1 Tax=Ditylenchus destructor TaxID=166010 RepID=A0AAD4MDU7_9BILA|nr:hypothetical protein DdX_22267 [Ditylenchus destructor]